MAGRTGDLVQRASVYHHLYEHSGRNHCFPLLAAHGALWASGYFRNGLRFGRVVAAGRLVLGDDPAVLLDRLHCFAEAFRDINRRVCLETYFIYHLSADRRLASDAERLIPADLLEAMERCHAARMEGRSLSDRERRDLFTAFFLWEQANIVGPAISHAFASFDWPLIRTLALRPKIRFSYFDSGPLAFANFEDTEERIVMGLRAFDRAARRGWSVVEQALDDYGVMPSAFTAHPQGFFDRLVEACRTAMDGDLPVPAAQG